MKTFGIGLIGFGFIGKAHAYGWTNIPLFYDPVPARVRLVGVATTNPASAEKARERGGFQTSTADWRELVARQDVDVIDIASPNRAHVEQLLAAIQAGKHVYCDKPLTATLAEAERVEEALRGYRGIGQMTFNNRFFPATLRAKQLIEEGYLGEVIGFRGSYLHAGSVDPSRPMGWKQKASEGAGTLRDLGSHLLDLADWLAGPLESVLAETRILHPERPDASGRRVRVEADDQVALLARTASGAVGTLEASKIATGAEDELRLEIHGSKGALRFNLMDPNWLEAYSLSDPETPLGGLRGWKRIATVQRYQAPAAFPGGKMGAGWLRGHMHCQYSFLSAVASGKQGEPSLLRGVRMERMLAAVAESAKSRSWVSL